MKATKEEIKDTVQVLVDQINSLDDKNAEKLYIDMVSRIFAEKRHNIDSLIADREKGLLR